MRKLDLNEIPVLKREGSGTGVTEGRVRGRKGEERVKLEQERDDTTTTTT